MKSLLRSVRAWRRRRLYRPGEVVSRFIARDVRRDVRIASVDRIDDGFIVGQVRTNNLLYVSSGLVEEQDYGDPVTLDVSTLWDWSGQPWGGLPDGTSIADHIGDRRGE